MTATWMNHRENLTRRIALTRTLSVLAGGLPTSVFARSPLPPPVDAYLSRSDLVFLGKVERLVFRGASTAQREEFRRDFEEQGPFKSRVIDVYVRPRTVLLQAQQVAIPAELRIHWPIPDAQRTEIIGSHRIFLVRKSAPYARADGSVQEIYAIVVEPLPVEAQSTVDAAIKKFNIGK